jgi:hypothetical protein
MAEDYREESNVDYNAIPVFYCKHCLSLNIKTVDESIDTEYLDFCANCGSTEIEQTDIHTWEKMYEQKYGKNFLTGEEV